MKSIITLLLIVISYNGFAQINGYTKPKKNPIDKVKVWANGSIYDADDLDVICVFEDYSNKVRWYYTLTDSTGQVVASGNVELTGDKYKDFASKPNHADRAVLLVMQQLNLQRRQQQVAQRAAAQAAATSGTTTKQ